MQAICKLHASSKQRVLTCTLLLAPVFGLKQEVHVVNNQSIQVRSGNAFSQPDKSSLFELVIITRAGLLDGYKNRAL